MDEIQLNELLELCSKNQELFDFVLKIINRERAKGLAKEDLVVFTSTGWNWDVEDPQDFNIDDRAIFAQYNLDFAVDLPNEEPWELILLEKEFCEYFTGFNYDKIRLDNGKLLFLIDNEDYLSFCMYDEDKIVDGAVDGLRWGMPHLYRESI